MWDFEIFDKASRGAWGSLLLLVRTKGRSLAAIGAILTLLLVANDTFFQQVVGITERWALKQGANSTVARVVHYNPRDSLEFRSTREIELLTADPYLRLPLQQFFYKSGKSQYSPNIWGGFSSSTCLFTNSNAVFQ